MNTIAKAAVLFALLVLACANDREKRTRAQWAEPWFAHGRRR